MVAHHGSGQAGFPHPGRVERRRCIGGQRGVAVTGSSSEHAGANTPVPRSAPQSVSYVPPFHPGRRDFPSPVGDSSFPLGAFP